jgi:Ca-activated chloride channel family protein
VPEFAHSSHLATGTPVAKDPLATVRPAILTGPLGAEVRVIQALGMNARRCRQVRPWGVFLVLGLLSLGSAVAETASNDIGPTSRNAPRGMTVDQLLALHHTETARVRMVMLGVSVTNRRGHFVSGLDAQDFRLFEDQVPQEIAFFAPEGEEPLSVAFLLDVSGSMRERNKLRRSKDAIRFLVNRLRPVDQFALICFADEQVAWITDFTRDRQRFLRRLEVQRAYGRTALVDALAAAPQFVHDKVATRNAIVLITDGNDNFSQTPVPEAIEMARRVNVPLFTIAFLSVDASWLPKGTVDTRLEAVRAVSRVTGGRVLPVYSEEQLRSALDLLDIELSSQYSIGYYPNDNPDNGEFQEIQLEVDKRRLQARTRSGYYAAP